jgi:hypothetical protein
MLFCRHGVGGITGMIPPQFLPMVKMQVYYMEVGMCLTSYDGINTSICLYLFERILFKITNRIIPMRVQEESDYGAGFVPT